MNNNTMIKETFNSAKHAGNYDSKAQTTKWHAPEIAFGMSYDYIKSGESVLDIGIGTGLSSRLFAKAGLTVHGIDFSEAMLEQCRGKGFTAGLTQHDLMNPPYAFDNCSFNHAVCIGVFHVIDDLSIVFRETERILCDGGIFVFSVLDCQDGENAEEQLGKFTFYRHNIEEISGLLEKSGFNLFHDMKFSAVHAGRENTLKMYLAGKTG